MFNEVSSCHTADVPSLSDFLPNPMSASMVANASVARGLSSSKLARRGGTKTLSLTYPHTEMSRGVISDKPGDQAIVPPCPIQATTVRLRQEDF
jgi:hypothetical protein